MSSSTSEPAAGAPDAPDPETTRRQQLATLLLEDPFRSRCLRATQVLPATGVWIGAGFVRSLVWDHLTDRQTPLDDVDVLWFSADAPPGRDAALERMLRSVLPEVPWSVRNQARMHERNGDAPYAGVGDAMRHWPETATAVAVRLDEEGGVDILAPFGLADLFALQVRPTPHMRSRADRRGVFAGRSLSKRWEKRWPGVVVEYPPL